MNIFKVYIKNMSSRPFVSNCPLRNVYSLYKLYPVFLPNPELICIKKAASTPVDCESCCDLRSIVLHFYLCLNA